MSAAKVQDEGRQPAALVGGEPITVAQVEARLAAIRRGRLGPWLPRSGPEDRRSRRWILRMLVTEAIIRRDAHVAGGPFLAEGAPPDNEVDPADAAGLAHAARQLFEQVTSGVGVTEEEVRAYYLRNLDRYQTPERRRIRQVVEVNEPRVRRAARRLRSDVREAAASFDLRRGEFAGPFEEAVFSAEVGDLIGPLESELGWHMAVVEAVFPAGHRPYEEVRSEIEADLLAAARGRSFDQWLDGRRRALAVTMPGWGHPGDPSSPDFVHRH